MMFSLINILFSSKLTLFASYAGGGACKKGDFLGLIPWWHYLPDGDFAGQTGTDKGCNIRNFHFISISGHPDLPLVLLAIVDDLLRIAGVVAVAYVLIGAFKYVTSQGDPEQAARAQSTIINALVGTAIAITAATFVNFLGLRLGGG
jgi:hypothetical protein